jgi:hypothetical protein
MADGASAPPCSELALAVEEPMFATASLVRSWLLLEQPGTWGADAFGQSGLPSDVGRTLRSFPDLGVRVLLLRRPDPFVPPDRHCFVGHSSGRTPWVEERRLEQPWDVLRVDPAVVAAGLRPGFGQLRSKPLYLVCTHSRHDQCCGRLGRPVARALAAVAGESVWECSHMGGERFAGNMVCLPHGLYFGRLDPASALDVMAAYEEGMVDLEHFRGRAGEPFVVQAAEHYARRALSLRGVDDLAPVSRRRSAPGVVDVELAGPGGERVRVRVGVHAAAEARRLTCGSNDLGRPRAYSLLDLSAG